jgi:hypothetical protein
MAAYVETVRNLSPERPVAPVGPWAPVGPVSPRAPVGPSIPSRFTLYMAATVKVPCIFVILLIVIAPVDVVYALTVPSNRFVVSVEFTTTTEFPGIYANPCDTVKLTEPLLGSIVSDDEDVRNLSPDNPVAPVGP